MEVPDDLEYVVLNDLTLEDRNYYLFVRDLEERKCRQEGVATEGELMEQARQSGYWGKDEDDIASRAADHIAFLEAEFEAKKKFRSRQNIIKLQIDDAKKKQAWVQGKRNEIRQLSAEYLAHEIAMFAMLRSVAVRPDGSLLIPDDATFLRLKEYHILFLYYLIKEMLNEGALDTPEVRAIARSTEWRLIWALSRENLPAIFGRGVGDLTLNHKMLIYWSRVYDSAFEGAEPPDNEVIDDDNLFDQWLADRDLQRSGRDQDTKAADAQERGFMMDGEYIEQCTCGAKKENIGKGLGERVQHMQTCLYGTWHTYSDLEKEAKSRGVYGKNSKAIRQIIDSEHEQILRHGVIEEQDLRHDRKRRAMLGMKTNVIPIRR